LDRLVSQLEVGSSVAAAAVALLSLLPEEELLLEEELLEEALSALALPVSSVPVTPELLIGSASGAGDVGAGSSPARREALISWCSSLMRRPAIRRNSFLTFPSSASIADQICSGVTSSSSDFSACCPGLSYEHSVTQLHCNIQHDADAAQANKNNKKAAATKQLYCYLNTRN